MSNTQTKIGLFRMEASSVDSGKIEDLGTNAPRSKKALRTVALVVIAVGCASLFFLDKQAAAPKKPVDPYLKSNLETASQAQTKFNNLYAWATSNITTAQLDFSEIDARGREALNALEQSDFYNATSIYDLSAEKLGLQLGGILERQYSMLMPSDKRHVLARYNPSLSTKLNEQQNFIEKSLKARKFDTFVTAQSELCEVATGGLMDLYNELSQSASAALSAGRLQAAAPLFADLQVLKPSNEAAADFFESSYYASGDLYVSPSGITFVYVESDSSLGEGGLFISATEINRALNIHAFGSENLNTNDAALLSSEQTYSLIELLKISDQIEYAHLNQGQFEDYLMLPSETDSGELAFNRFGITHSDSSQPEWVEADGALKIATHQTSNDAEEETLLVVDATAKAQAHLRLSFVPDKLLPLINR